MLITWLKGIHRVKTDTFTEEIAGYRCSHCNLFSELPLRVCPRCSGEYQGKLLDQGDSSDV